MSACLAVSEFIQNAQRNYPAALGAGSREERPAQKHIQIMDRKGKPSKNVGRILIDRAGFHAPPRPVEPQAESQLLIGVAKFPQETADLGGPAAGGVNGLEGGRNTDVAPPDGLVQGTLKLLAANRICNRNRSDAVKTVAPFGTTFSID